MKKWKKLIDEAFRQSLQSVCDLYGIEPEQLSVTVRFTGTQVLLFACQGTEVLKRMPITLLLSRKLLGLRYDVKKIQGIFKALQFTFTSYDTLIEADDVSLIVYNSKKAEKPCVSVLVNDQPQKTLVISDVIEALELGVEQFN